MAATEIENDLRRRLALVRRTIAAAAEEAHRDPGEITLIAVSKTHPASNIGIVASEGQLDFGENRVQEAEEKIPQLADSGARWHLIGHLQSNKARKAVQLFDVIHSVDSAELAVRLDRVCDEIGRSKLEVLIQVDLAGEATKTGIDENELPRVVDQIAELSHLSLAGLMTLPPYYEDPELVRPFFQKLRGLRDGIRQRGGFQDRIGHLSMGMSHDFRVAIAEGATMVRVGTAIFGERNR